MLSQSMPGRAQEALDTTPVKSDFNQASHSEGEYLLIEGIHDLFAERQSLEELWEKWQQPEIWRLPHGHVSALFVPGLTGRVLGWLAPRLEAGRKNNE
jgi:hypothetical protein